MSKIKLLLVDDEEEYVRTMATRLELRDVASRVALSGEEALRAVEAETPDVMVLDLRMPGIDGMEVLERVKAEHPRVQVVILTGHGSEREEREARRLGAFDYLEKPADTKQVLKTVRAAWKKGLALLKESADGFSRTMTAAALAEGGLADAAREEVRKPAPRKAETGPAPSVSPEAAAPPLVKVLFVDDEEDFVTTMAERMRLRDVGSDVALSGDRALEMLADEVPDVMVLDLRMPGLDGLEVLRRVKQAYPRMEVIILTGHGSEQDEEEARRLGAFDYLGKPVDINRLVETIRKAGRAGRVAE
jgi:DNA-binding NtrC family response regulator